MSTHEQVDRAESMGFIPPEGGVESLMPEVRFRAQWGFKNTGSTTWHSGYKFVYTGGSQPSTAGYPHAVMAERSAFTLAELGIAGSVLPGQSVSIPLSLTTPTAAGTHATTWQLQTPDGRPFGPVRWMRATVVAKAEQAPPASQEPLAPQAEVDDWRAAVWAITSIFESGSPEGRADAFQNKDKGIVSYGKHQATLESGNLERVLSGYFRRSSSATSQALQQEFGSRVQEEEEALRHNGRFKQGLLDASKEAAMEEAQDELFATNFYRPVVAQAKELGINTALGVACLYDTRIQGGLGQVITAVSQKLGIKKAGDGSVDESTWLHTFLNEREARLHRLADIRESENDQQNAEWLRTSTYRVTELRQLLNGGNLDLIGEFSVRDHLIQGLRRDEDSPGRERPVTVPIKAEPETHVAKPTPEPTPDSYHGPKVKFVAGIHGPGDSYMWQQGGLRNMLTHLNMPVKFMSDGDRSKWYKEFNKPQLSLVRVFWKPNSQQKKTAQQAWDEDIRDGVMRFYQQGARDFEVHNEPRLGHEGMGHQWQNGAQFGNFLRQLMLIIKKKCPGVRLWYPGESPGVPWTEQFNVTRPAYKKVADLCYGICQHAYAGNTTNVETAVAEIVDQVRKFHKAMNAWDKPIIVSESSVNRAASPEFRAKVYTKVAQELAQIPGVQGIFWYISHWNPPSGEVANAESWYGTDLPDRYKRLNLK